jgi:hypothetical protein
MSDVLIPIEPAPDYNDRTQKYLMPPFQDITASEVMAEFEKRCGSGQQYTTFPNTISDGEKAKLEAAGYVVTANTIDSENIDGVEPTYIGFQVALNDTAAAKSMVIGQKGENGIGGGGDSATLIEKSITENGVYNASDDNADGYSKVTVDVAGSGGETFVVNVDYDSEYQLGYLVADKSFSEAEAIYASGGVVNIVLSATAKEYLSEVAASDILYFENIPICIESEEEEEDMQIQKLACYVGYNNTMSDALVLEWLYAPDLELYMFQPVGNPPTLELRISSNGLYPPTYTADKTFAEVRRATNYGSIISVYLDGNKVQYPGIYVGDNAITISVDTRIDSDDDVAIVSSKGFTLYDDNTIKSIDVYTDIIINRSKANLVEIEQNAETGALSLISTTQSLNEARLQGKTLLELQVRTEI